MIILHYAAKIWRLPTRPSSGSFSHSLLPLTTAPDTTLQDMEIPDNWDQEEVSPFSERELKALKIQAVRKVLVKTWHDSLGHLHSGNLSHSLKKMGIPTRPENSKKDPR
jgi:hypothetical protein